MAKVSGSYESVVRGVSEQVPQDRRSGQHYEQDNMISDPVRGLARRHGSMLMAETAIGNMSAADLAVMLEETRDHKSITFYVDGKDYDLIYRTVPSTLGMDNLAYCYDRTAGAFLPVQKSDDAELALIAAGGVSAAVNVGRYLYIAGHNLSPSYTTFDAFGQHKDKAAVWVRGGAYSRTFKVEVTRSDGSKVVASYKTLSSSYPHLLDTSDIPVGDTNYQAKVNARVLAYNSEVTKWIGTAAADITPENIATKLAEGLTAQGVIATANGSTVVIDFADMEDISAEDGGDGTLLHAVGSEVRAPELVATTHWVGKVVKVKPARSNGEDAFYLKAVAKTAGEEGWADVSWRECAGVEMRPTSVFGMATVYNGVCYLAGGPDALEDMVGFDVPNYKANEVGDQITSQAPSMFGKKITYLGVFQDRLIIGSGATLLASRPGDYLNWFRKSIITVNDADPWEGYALGAEDDEIIHGTTYDRNLLLYGRRFQYAINGRVPLNPKTASIVIVSSYEDAVDAAPQASGNYVFYGKYAGEPGAQKASLHQVQAGAVAENPESYDVSQQLDGYIKGRPVEIVALTKPNTVMLRTDAEPNVLYTYGYLDNANASERLQDSWSRWTWASQLGAIAAMSSHDGGLLVYMLRSKPTGLLGERRVYMAAERFVRDTGLADYPYLDSLRPYHRAVAITDHLYLDNPELRSVSSVVLGKGAEHRLMGRPMAQLAEFEDEYPTELTAAWVGANYPAFTIPTNPYLRDRNDKAILNGRLTLGRVIVSFADTAGLIVEVDTSSGTKTTLDFNGRILGHSSNVAGYQPVLSSSLSAVVGREVRECTYSLKAKTWLPLTVTAIEWTGQYFNNSRRV